MRAGDRAEQAMQAMDGGGADLERLLRTYARDWPAEAAVVDDFDRLHAGRGAADPFARAHLPGHFTGSAWLVSGDGERVLLTHHRKLGLWLQLGGHADGDADLARVALREAEEESGLTGLVVEPALFDIDRHRIPAHGADPEHWHYDVRFVVRATGSEAFAVSEESLALAWRPVADVAADDHADPSVRRMASKWMRRESGI